jgi:hypothetical protein
VLQFFRVLSAGAAPPDVKLTDPNATMLQMFDSQLSKRGRNAPSEATLSKVKRNVTPMPPAQRPTPPLPTIFDRLATPRWLPILLFWVLVLAGFGIYRLVV